MWKFVRRTAHQHSSVEKHQKVQKDLFHFRKTVRHGFPSKPTALAWDSELRIMAIGTAQGIISVVGQPGVEFTGQHLSSSEHSVVKLLFIPNEGRLISLCEDNSLHLWRINDSAVEEVTSFVMKERVKKISALYIEKSKEQLLVGTEGGNVYSVDLRTFTLLEDHIVYQDVAMQNVPEGKKINPGAVEAIAEQPGNSENILIGYRRGLMVLWNKKDAMAVQTYINNQQLESFSWDMIGKKFLSSHNDGSYVVWCIESSEPVEEPITVYGPFPCKAITKIQWCKCADDNDEDLIVFSGGMPRASYSDRNTVTIQQGTNKHVVLDFTSKVIDFFVTYSIDSEVCETLIILLEEELVAVDLTTTEWRPIQLPYLISLHASAVTYLTYNENLSEHVWKNLMQAGSEQNKDVYSKLSWPINGGYLKEDESVQRLDVLISGHEDGCVRFWNAGTSALSLLYTFKTNQFFSTEDEAFEDVGNHAEEEEEEWPPFRKVGCFDPFSDDPRLSIRKIAFCGSTGLLVIGGAAGQVLINKIENSVDSEVLINVVTINIIPEKDNPDEVTYLWKGAQKLPLKGKCTEDNKISLSVSVGYQPTNIVQMLPPAAVTALTYHTSWCLIAIGTAHGLALFDYKTEMTAIQKCTLNTNDFSSLSEPPISRTKSFKKSLRESFRRIRKGRASVRQPEKQRGGSKTSSTSSPVSPLGVDRKRGCNEIASSSSPVISPLEARPVERAIEARPADDAMGSVVKCLNFFMTHIVTVQQSVPSLWAGTNNGTVYIFTLNIPGGTSRKNEKATAQLAKEIQLKHRAPVVAMGIINMANRTVQIRDSENSGPHYVVISSEEQVKLFALPNLKPICKLKLTAIEGARIRRAMLGLFTNGNYSEFCLQCLTNLGECIILSIPELRRQMTAAIIKREDITGISSFTFTNSGEGLYLHSSSEIQRITLSSTRKTIPKCSLDLSSNKSQCSESPCSPEKQVNPTGHNIITNGIPEEDEDEMTEEHENNVNSPPLKKELNEDVKKPMSDEENQIMFNHDVSAITLDSVKDHLAS